MKSKAQYNSRWLKAHFIELREQFGGKCSVCGSTKQLEFAHVKPTELSGTGRGKWNRDYDIKKNPECYRLLCGDCHDELDLKCPEDNKVKMWKELKRKFLEKEIRKNA